MKKQIFVFGSNLAGKHGKGAALDAVKFHGAIYGQGLGLQGRSYAIPTKDEKLQTLPIESIRAYISIFLNNVYALREEYEFNITKIGSGLAGYNWEKDILPLFPNPLPENCRFI